MKRRLAELVWKRKLTQIKYRTNGREREKRNGAETGGERERGREREREREGGGERKGMKSETETEGDGREQRGRR